MRFTRAAPTRTVSTVIPANRRLSAPEIGASNVSVSLMNPPGLHRFALESIRTALAAKKNRNAYVDTIRGMKTGFALCVLSLSAWAGPPFQTDDPEPIDFRHYE